MPPLVPTHDPLHPKKTEERFVNVELSPGQFYRFRLSELPLLPKFVLGSYIIPFHDRVRFISEARQRYLDTQQTPPPTAQDLKNLELRVSRVSSENDGLREIILRKIKTIRILCLVSVFCILAGSTAFFFIGKHDGKIYGSRSGYDLGYKSGYSDGSDQSYDYAYDDGYDHGYNDGYDRGSRDAYDEGYNQGYEIGYGDSDSHTSSASYVLNTKSGVLHRVDCSHGPTVNIMYVSDPSSCHYTSTCSYCTPLK